MNNKNHLDRRNFMKKSTLGVIGAGVAAKSGMAAETAQEPEPLKIKEYRTLGRTGFKVSDLATGYIQDEGVFATMLDAGVNFIDTAESYPGHHKLLGQVLKGRDRKKLFLNSKMLLDEGDITKEGLLKRANKGLEDLQTDYFDCMMLHFPATIDILKTESFHQAMDQLKAEGKVRFVGASHHGSFWYKASDVSMDKILLAAVEDGRFDIFLLAYNFLQMDGGERVLEACEKKGVGTVIMKSTPVAKFYGMKARADAMKEKGKELNPFIKEGLERYQKMMDHAEGFIKKYDLEDPADIKDASIRFVLNNPKVNAVCCSLQTYEEAERVLKLSGGRLSDMDKAKLAQYEEAMGPLYCRHACGLCEPECPQGVPINTIMRYNHYFAAQGREKEAMLKYNRIPGANADVCSCCPGYCERACPHNVPIQGMLLLAHNLMGWPS
jgi:predicted aldo/keto reductase-like oxidoreductase